MVLSRVDRLQGIFLWALVGKIPIGIVIFVVLGRAALARVVVVVVVVVV